ncbi:MAG: putative peptidoglycan lipid flippase [Actinomycetota bacterium]|nr:putative peptidoglycan lipid flippase [Actinomycetota bacterium]
MTPPGPVATVGASLTVASWTLVSRVTGLLRIIAIGAVLGPTYLGNTFQAVNQFPNLTYQALTGSLLSMMLVPLLVRHVDAGDEEESARVAGGFMGLTMTVFAVLSVVVIAVGPVIMRLFTLGVADPAVASAQRHAGWIMLATVMPQVVLYGVAGAGEAVMNAHGRFALAAAAPAFENIGVVIVMGIAALLFGTGTSVGGTRTAELLLLGLGSTGAVLLHAGAQWWGARRVGVTLIPRLGWRDPEVRARAREMLPSLGYASLSSLRYFGILVVANRVPGGVVAFQLALNFIALPVGLGAWPVSVVLLPQLARLYLAGATRRFRDELVKGTAMTFFLIIPAAAAYVVLAHPLARGVAYGEMRSAAGVALVAASLAGLGAGMVGEAGSVIGTHAAYARGDPWAPLSAMVVRTIVSAVGMTGALLVARGPAVVLVLGLAVSLGNAVGALYLARDLRSQLPAGEPLTPALLRTVDASVLMIVPAYLAARLFPVAYRGPLSHVLSLVAAGVIGVGTFLFVQRAWHSPELDALRQGFGQMLGRAA